MKKLTRRIAKILLGAVTAIVPVVIAACYGMYYAFSRDGRALDARNHGGVEGILVTCRSSGTGGAESATAVTGTDGSFLLEYDTPCDTVTFEDTDGAANGGTFATQSIPLPPEGEPIVVELNLAVP